MNVRVSPDTMRHENKSSRIWKSLSSYAFHMYISVFTSRPKVDIRSAMGFLAVSLHEQLGHKQDISDYIEFIFSSDRHKEVERRRKAIGQGSLLEGSPRDVSYNLTAVFTFILISVQHCEGFVGSSARISSQIETLRGCFPSSIRRALNDLPETLNGTYEQTLQTPLTHGQARTPSQAWEERYYFVSASHGSATAPRCSSHHRSYRC